MKVLNISLGSIGERHCNNTLLLDPECELYIYSYSGQRSIKGARYIRSIEDIQIIRPNLTVISSPANLHLETLNYVKDFTDFIFVEKPISNKLQNTVDFDVYDNIFLGYVLRFHPLINFVKHLIDENVLGKIYSIEAIAGQWLPDWRSNKDYRLGVSAKKELGGGVLLELSHEIDYTIFLFGFPKYYTGFKSKVSSLEVDVEDNATLLFGYDSGLIAKINLDFLQKKPNLTLSVFSEKYNIKLDFVNNKISLEQDYPFVNNFIDPRFNDSNFIYLIQFDYIFSLVNKSYKRKYSNKSFNTATVNDGMNVLKVINQITNIN